MMLAFVRLDDEGGMLWSKMRLESVALPLTRRSKLACRSKLVPVWQQNAGEVEGEQDESGDEEEEGDETADIGDHGLVEKRRPSLVNGSDAALPQREKDEKDQDQGLVAVGPVSKKGRAAR